MKIYKDIEQGTDEWFEIRKGKMTASNAQAIGNNGKGLDSYIIELMSEYYSSEKKEQYTNDHIERGKELESIARNVYELENNVEVEQIGFIEYDKYIGCSPDGLVNHDGGIEIKCINDVAYFKLLLNREKEIDTKYIWQVQMCLLVTGRKWWDLCFYNPNYKESMVIFRIEPDKEKHDALKKGFEIGKNKIIEIQEIFNK